MKYLRLFELLNDYQNAQSGDGGFMLPNVSFVRETKNVFYNPKSKPSEFMVCTYYSPSADEEVRLFNEDAFLAYTPDGEFPAIEKMYINDVEVEINPYHVFGSEGEHVVKYKLYQLPETESPTGELIKGSYINDELFAAPEEGDAYLTKVELPSNCCYIGAYAFAGQTNLTNDFVINESVKLVGQGFLYSVPADLYINSKFIEQEYDMFGPVFEGCMAKNLYIGDNVTEFSYTDEYGYANETQSLLSLSIENLYFGKNIKKVNLPFFNSTLQNIYLPNIESLFNIEWLYFRYTSYLFTNRNIYVDNNSLYEIEDLVIPNGATKIYEHFFGNYDLNNNLKSVIIPNSVTEIETSAFQGCPNLNNVIINGGVIGLWAFENCSSLANVTIGNDVTEIGGNAFSNCTSLTSITIPDSVTRIGNGAFDHCSSLANVTISSGITEINEYTFSWCENLMNVYCKAINPPTFNYNRTPGAEIQHPFYNVPENCKFYVPMESVDAYKAAPDWSGYANYIEGYNF